MIDDFVVAYLATLAAMIVVGAVMQFYSDSLLRTIGERRERGAAFPQLLRGIACRKDRF
jgi:hypothetical protein